MIIWDFEKRVKVAQHDIHKVRVESVSFSCDSRYLVSLGGRDDGNVVVWDIPNEEAMCGEDTLEELAVAYARFYNRQDLKIQN